jgi:hypothetical protein
MGNLNTQTSFLIHAVGKRARAGNQMVVFDRNTDVNRITISPCFPFPL